MKDLIFDEFQNKAEEVLVRHSSFLDVTTKLSQYIANANRACVKTITECGCMSLSELKINEQVEGEEGYEEHYSFKSQDIEGKICPKCREKLEEELGKAMFYTAALCNKMDLNLYDIFLKEYKNINALGKYTLY